MIKQLIFGFTLVMSSGPAQVGGTMPSCTRKLTHSSKSSNTNLNSMSPFFDFSNMFANMRANVLDWLVETNGTPAIPNGRWYAYEPGPRSNWVPADNVNVKGKRIAITIHGLFGSLNDVGSLADFLKDRMRLNDSNRIKNGRYDLVLGYNYNVYPSIKSIAQKFAKDLQPIISQAQYVDIYAHSMGGLVSRWAIEKEGAGKNIRRLIMFATPHKGIPVAIFKPVLGLLPAGFTSARDMQTRVLNQKIVNSSEFLKQLNEGSSPFKDNIEYYTLAGSKYNTMPFIGEFVHNGYVRLFGKNTISDGLVADYSANADVLGGKSAYWAKNALAKKVLPFDHMEIVGTCSSFMNPNPGIRPKIPDGVTEVLQMWANNWL